MSAPTGSGKTLAYLVPLLSVLCHRVVPRLRALVILPTRDLARQLLDVLRPLAAALGLRADIATGQHGSFASEQRRLVGTGTGGYDTRSGAGAGLGEDAGAWVPRAGSSLVDILVCTPGRLIDHLQSTPGFTLQHLEFLVRVTS